MTVPPCSAELRDLAGPRRRRGIGRRQDQDLVLGGTPFWITSDVAEEVVLHALVAEHVLPGLADEVRRAQPCIAVAVDPGLAVGLGIQDPESWIEAWL